MSWFNRHKHQWTKWRIIETAGTHSTLARLCLECGDIDAKDECWADLVPRGEYEAVFPEMKDNP